LGQAASAAVVATMVVANSASRAIAIAFIFHLLLDLTGDALSQRSQPL
jgi:hypothetical protein